MSEIQANKLSPSSGTALQVGDSGDTITIPSGCTITNSGTATNFGASLSGSTNNTVVTVTGANAMQGEANMTFDGTTLQLSGDTNEISTPSLRIKDSTDSRQAYITNNAGDLLIGTEDGDNTPNAEVVVGNGSQILLKTANSTRMLVDSSGDIYIGKTSGGQNEVGVKIESSAGAILATRSGAVAGIFTRKSTDGEVIRIMGGTATLGTISISGSSTSYNTSSDYRLKENEVAISDGIERLKQLKPYRFNFKTDADKIVDGFFAHEVSSIVPEAIQGKKDAVDSEGNPEYQGIDQAKLVPLLTSALQEAITKIETLEARVQALESE